MRVHRSLAFLAAAFMLAQPAWAAPPSAGSASRAAPPARGGFAPEVTTPITPQFNDPGRQLTVPQSGNPVQQLSPMDNQGQPDSLGIK